MAGVTDSFSENGSATGEQNESPYTHGKSAYVETGDDSDAGAEARIPRPPARAKTSTMSLVMVWVFPVVIMLVVNIGYQSVAYYANHSYLKWAEKYRYAGHLPDLALDRVRDDSPMISGMTTGADTVPAIIVGAAIIACLLSRDATVFNRLLLTQSVLLFLNAIVENGTVIPASYGYHRCVKYLGIDKNDCATGDRWHCSDYDTFQIRATGSCAAMMWSGHMLHLMLFGYTLLFVLRRQFHGTKFCAQMERRFLGVALYNWVLVPLAILQAVLLLGSKGHYISDIVVSWILFVFFTSNDWFDDMLCRANPWLVENTSRLALLRKGAPKAVPRSEPQTSPRRSISRQNTCGEVSDAEADGRTPFIADNPVRDKSTLSV